MRRGRKLFETTGRGTRRRHDLPLVYVRGGDDLVALAANADADPTPAWWLNLRTAGEVGTVVKGHQRMVAPSVVEGTRRDRVWRRFRAASPVEYRRGRTTRRLPVVGVDRERRPDGPITYFDERELSTR